MLDGLTTSVAVKAPVRAVSSGNLTLSGLQTVGGVVLAEGDRVLVRLQTDAVENGIYDASSGSWTRSADFDGNRDVVKGTLIVTDGVSTALLFYRVDSDNPIVIGTSEIDIDPASEVQDPYPVLPSEVGVTDTSYHYGHLYRHGTNAVPGATDMTTAHQNMSLSSLVPFVPGGENILITGATPIRASQQWQMQGAQYICNSGTVEVLTATAVDDWAIKGKATFTGDNGAAGATSGTMAAIRITDCMRFHIDPMVFKNLRGWGFRVRPGSSTGARGEKGVIMAPQAYACYIAFECEAGTGAEYINVIGHNFCRNNTAWKVAAGNLNVTGGSTSDNTLGVSLVNGTNHGHGIFGLVQFNHNVTQIFADTVTNSHSFEGCHFYQGIIHFKNSTGVVAHGGVVDVDAFRFEESDGCGFINAKMPASYANAISNNYNGTNSYTLWSGCKTLTGQPWNGALGNIKGIRVSATQTSDQTISAANVNATSTIILDTKATASANQATQSVAAYLLSYDTSTGIYTCVKGGDGKVRVAAQFVITVNTADADNFQVFLTHSALGDYYCSLIPLGSHASATSWIATLNAELPIDLTQTLRFRITGSGVANNVVIENSGGTKAQVEGL